MNILALETGGAAVGIAALVCGANSAAPLAARTLAQTRQLSSQIIACIDATLRQAGWTLEDVDAVVVGLGPGSWTGLRIGLTTCKTLAQVRGWALCGVPTFDAMAYGIWHAAQEDDAASTLSLPEHFLILATAPCRADEIYGKIYECHSEYLSIVQSEWIGTAELMAAAAGAEALAREIEAPLVLVGAASPAVEVVLAGQKVPSMTFPMTAEVLAVEIGRHGALLLEDEGAADPLALQPLYLAPSAAERNLVNAG